MLLLLLLLLLLLVRVLVRAAVVYAVFRAAKELWDAGERNLTAFAMLLAALVKTLPAVMVRTRRRVAAQQPRPVERRVARLFAHDSLARD
jgi:predicted Co/Zn/Cd cation transporter (cation efflux family)